MFARTVRSIFIGLLLGVAGAANASAQAADSGRSTTPPAADLPMTAPASLTDEAPASLTRTMPSLRSIFTELPHDVRGLPTVANGAWLGAAGALAIAVHENDQRITHDAAGAPHLEDFLDGGSPIGSAFVQVGGALGTYALGRLVHRPRVAAVGAELMRAQIIDATLTQGIKFVVNRQRPGGGRYSFPSGHTSSAFATATVLYRHFGWKAGVPGYALAAYVAGSRLSENKHFLSDVLFGAGIGIVSGRTVSVGHSHAFAIAPAVSPGAVGVTVTSIGRR